MILVIDLEATCSDDGSITPEQMEVIELGAAWATPAGEVIDTLQRFVRPTERPTLTPFCRSLTHIEQASIDTAPSWPAVRWPWKVRLRRWPERRPPARARLGMAARGHAGCRAQGCRSGFSSLLLLWRGTAAPCDAIVASRQAKRASRKQLCDVEGVREGAVMVAFQLKSGDL